MKISQYSGIAAAVVFCALPALAQTKGDAAKGKAVFEQCSACHNTDTTDRKMGPGLKGLFKKAKLESNGKPVTDASVLSKIDNGENGMPAYKDTLSADDKVNLLAYLKTL